MPLKSPGDAAFMAPTISPVKHCEGQIRPELTLLDCAIGRPLLTSDELFQWCGGGEKQEVAENR